MDRSVTFSSPKSSSVISPEKATRVPTSVYPMSWMYWSIWRLYRTAAARESVTTMALACPSSSPATLARKCSTMILTFCAMFVGCSLTHRMSFLLASVWSTSVVGFPTAARSPSGRNSPFCPARASLKAVS